ncbi:MAG: ankyrin repeat domain-containing protein [Candidatus Methylacidiphilales bacterium]|nr:ankyrin repeat domain-containing protein [Candidatus Methylacidiphilales bacterium]
MMKTVQIGRLLLALGGSAILAGFVTVGDSAQQLTVNGNDYARKEAKQHLTDRGITVDSAGVMKAADQCDVASLELLRLAGADLNARDPETGLTALHLAIARQSQETVAMLLKYAKDINQQDEFGFTPLMTASLSGNTQAVKLLLEKKASVDITSKDGRTALHHAVSLGRVEITHRLLLAKAQPDVPDADRVTALMMAVDEGSEKLAELLLQAGANANQYSPTLQQPLLISEIARNRFNFVALLLQYNADPNTMMEEGRALSPEFSKLIAGKAINNDSKITSLMIACALGRDSMVQRLVAHRAELYRRSGKWKRVALDFAAFNREVGSMQVLFGKIPDEKAMRLEVSLSKQTVTVYQDGKVLTTSPVSTGRPGYKTPSGTYVVTHKYEHWISTLYHAPMPFFMRLSCGSFGLHAGALPGYPASHGCIRMPLERVKEFFQFVELGTVCTIVD